MFLQKFSPFWSAVEYSYRSISGALIALVLVGGVAFALVLPPFEVADEDYHWVSAVDQSESLFSTIMRREPQLCSSMVALSYFFDVNPTKGNLTTRYLADRFSKLGTLTPQCHNRPKSMSVNWFSYPGVTLARLAVQNEVASPYMALLTFYLSRIFNGLMIVFTLWRLWYFAAQQRLVMPGILSLSALCLSPIFLNQAFGVTYDSVCLAFTLFSLHMVAHAKQLRLLDFTFYALVAIGACITKPVFLPLAAVVAVLVSIRRRSLTISALSCSFIAGLVVACIAVTSQDMQNITSNHMIPAGVDAYANRQFLISDPLRAFHILWNSVGPYLTFGNLTTPLGWMNIQPSPFVTTCWLTIIFAALGVDLIVAVLALIYGILRHRSFRALFVRSGAFIFESLSLVAGGIASAVLTGAALYIRWTQSGSMGVSGLQTRYFIPVFITSIGCLCLVTYQSIAAPPGIITSKTNASKIISFTAAAFGIGLGILSLRYIACLTLELVTRFY